MKKYLLFLLMLTASLNIEAQTTLANKLRITGNVTDNTATKLNVQATDGTVNTRPLVDLQDAFYFATASALPVVGITDKLYITRDDNKLYRFNGTIYVPLNSGITSTATTNFIPKVNAGGNLVNSTISEDANGVLIQGNYVGANIAPLVVKNNTPYGAPFTQMIALFQNSAGVNMLQLRADGLSTFQSFASMASLSIRDLGTAATASIRLGNVNGTGLFSPSANAIAFTAGGTEAGRIHTSRRWSINSTTDDGINPLQVNGTVKASPAVTSDQLATLGQINTVDANNVKLTGFQEITGLKSYRPSSGATGLQVIATAGATGNGIFVDSQNTGYNGFLVNTNGTGANFVGQNNGTTTFIVDKLGVVTLVGGTALNNAVPRSQLLYNSQTITANKTVTTADFANNNELILSVNATSGNITVTLPTFNDLRGYKVTIKKMDSSANSVLIQSVGGINIDGSATLILSGQYGKATVGANLEQYIIL